MRLQDLLKEDFFSLPLYQPPKQDFKLTLFKLFDTFIQKLNELQLDRFDDAPEFPIQEIIERQSRLISRIKQSIEYVYDGRPSKAFESLDSGLVSDLKDFSEILNIVELPILTNFYRIRIYKENYPLPNDNFFHIPFNLRGKVKTQRFSIPGFPSLYLGNSIYVCWEELKRPNINEFQAVRLKSTSVLKVVDLSTPSEGATANQLYRYLMTWPLIMASSVKVRSSEDYFKPEYIVPQLLLQWVRENQEVDGIAYQTTHIDLKATSSKGKFTNFVLPVKENKIRGLCEVLKNKFEISNPISNQLSQLASGAGSYLYTSEEIRNLNPNIESIELIKGKKSIYGNSILGDLERQLNYMHTQKIDTQEQTEII